jgi:probable HAF family extracellular repeat protein
MCGITLAQQVPPVGMWSITDLGTLQPPYSDVSSANYINANGQIVGESGNANINMSHPFIYTYNGVAFAMLDLGAGRGGETGATCINSSGQVVGYSYPWPLTGPTHAFLYADNRMVDLGTLIGSDTSSYSFANGINDLGQVVGNSSTPSNQQGAFIYSAGKMTTLGTLYEANAINNLGQVAGLVDNGNGVYHASMYSAGSMIDLGTLGGFSSRATAINNNGQVAGGSGYSTNRYDEHAFVYSNGTMKDLGVLQGKSQSVACAINDRCEVCGYSFDTNLVSTAFYYTNGVMIDLNTAIAGTGWRLVRANAINNAGAIVGFGVNRLGGTHAFLLTPVLPVPLPVLACRSYAGYIVLSWSTNSLGYSVQSSPDLSMWNDSVNTLYVRGTNYVVTNWIGSMSTFYRLWKSN